MKASEYDDMLTRGIEFIRTKYIKDSGNTSTPPFKVDTREEPYLGQEYHMSPPLKIHVDTPPFGKAGHSRFHEILDEMKKLHEAKNHDYAGGGKEGALGNFIRVGLIKRMYPKFDWSSPFGVAMAYYLKQLDAVMHMYEQKKESAVGEGIPERLMDMATYAPIMIILLEETEGPPKQGKMDPIVLDQ